MSVFLEGQAIFGRITFTDGEEPEYDRPYLIITVAEDHIEVLNVSSIKGKERKLAFPTNEEIRNYNPPFIKPSFVKLDSLTMVPYTECESLQLMCGGSALDKDELLRIKGLLK